MGKSADVPPTPDYTGAANATAAGSKELATQANYANRPTQNTPWGQQFWTTGQQVDPATGQPVTTWTQNQTLDPALQSALNDQLGIQSGRSQLAGGFMGRVADEYANPFDWTNLPGMAQTPQQQFTYGRNMQSYIPTTTRTTNEPAFASERQRIENSLFERMRPEQDRQTAQLQTQLANQGLTPGSQAYNMELQRLADQQSRERYGALEMGGQEQARLQQMLLGQQQQAFGQGATQGEFFNQAQQQMFGQDMGANAQNYQQMMQAAQYQNQLRQQAIAEQQLGRSMSLNEMNALLSGQQVGTPQMPGFMSAQTGQAPQLLNAAMAQGQYGLGGAQIGAQQNAGLWGGLGSLAGGTAKYWGPLFGLGA